MTTTGTTVLPQDVNDEVVAALEAFPQSGQAKVDDAVRQLAGGLATRMYQRGMADAQAPVTLSYWAVSDPFTAWTNGPVRVEQSPTTWIDRRAALVADATSALAERKDEG